VVFSKENYFMNKHQIFLWVFKHIAINVKNISTFLLCYRIYGQIWLNCLTDDVHFSYITKLENKTIREVSESALKCHIMLPWNLLSFFIMYETRLEPLEQHWNDRHVYGSLYNMICFSIDVGIAELGSCLASVFLGLWRAKSLESLVTR
jgi:hypothetical protein